MEDKERILTHIFSTFYPRYLLCMDNRMDLIKNLSEINVGDLVLAVTSGIHEFTIGYVVDKMNEADMVLREIGSKNTCKISNEMFYKIDTSHLSKHILLEGEQYKLYLKTVKALNKFIDTSCNQYRFMEMEFEGSIATVYLRKKWHEYNKETAPKFSFSYNTKTTQKSILKAIEDGLLK
ncbi:hypothetical protein CF067_17550 [Clostridium sporogenes]|uniref:Uncharacterized protein n=1 Tax=Clostridium botulinum B str. Osaka05 TaxID=1407017 RepID=A0A060N3W9_CLOBO|nr:hypothetical protein [Clostridium botulinum]BAO05231.1 uncharacterized protein CBO05P2_206 [Clostridium botulinum B str. Osaka05]